MTLEEYREKRRNQQIPEAKALVRAYWERFGTEPPREVLCEYFSLFCTVEKATAVPTFRRRMENGGTLETCLAFLGNHPPVYESYEAFLADCREEERC